jgi:hypothetical protein
MPATALSALEITHRRPSTNEKPLGKSATSRGASICSPA